VIEAVENVLAGGEAVIMLVDDDKARIAILGHEFDIDLIGTIVVVAAPAAVRVLFAPSR
jgi:hypothetical protein